MSVNTNVALGIPDLMKALSNTVTAFFQDDMHKNMDRKDADQVYLSAMSHMLNMAILQCVAEEDRLSVFEQMKTSFFVGKPVKVPDSPEEDKMTLFQQLKTSFLEESAVKVSNANEASEIN